MAARKAAITAVKAGFDCVTEVSTVAVVVAVVVSPVVVVVVVVVAFVPSVFGGASAVFFLSAKNSINKKSINDQKHQKLFRMMVFI